MSGSLGGEQTSGAVNREWRRGTDIAQMEKKEGAAFLRLGDEKGLVRGGCEGWERPCRLGMFTACSVHVTNAALRLCDTRIVSKGTSNRGVG